MFNSTHVWGLILYRIRTGYLANDALFRNKAISLSLYTIRDVKHACAVQFARDSTPLEMSKVYRQSNNVPIHTCIHFQNITSHVTTDEQSDCRQALWVRSKQANSTNSNRIRKKMSNVKIRMISLPFLNPIFSGLSKTAILSKSSETLPITMKQ